MKRFSAIGLCALLTSCLSFNTFAAPTRTFFIETPQISAVGSVSIDIEYPFLAGGTTAAQGTLIGPATTGVLGTTGGSSTSLRIGTEGGEFFLNNARSGLTQTSMGYKAAIRENIAVYTVLSHVRFNASNSSFSEIALGATTAIKINALTLTANAEFIASHSSTFGNDNILFVNGAITYPIDNILANSSLIAELHLDNDSAVDTSSAFGLRWQPTKRLTADLIVYINSSSSVFAIPGYVILNYAF